MSKKEAELLAEIKTKFKADARAQRGQRIWITIDSKKLIEICKWIKKQGFEHISAISVTDWLEK